jgi:hypothetical protein
MYKNKIIGYLHGAIAIPLIALGPVSTTALSQISALSGQNMISTSAITEQIEQDQKSRAAIVDAFFASYDAPLEGQGLKFVTEADKHDIDWRLLPAIAMRESTGGKQACKKVPNSVFGYGSCKFGFKSIEESIEKVSQSLGGNDPKTARHYADKTTEQILKKYNPDSIIPGYSKQVIKIMKMIDDSEEIV